MPDWDWQVVVALGIVSVAMGFLVRRAVRMVRSGSRDGCASGGCGSCSSGAAPESTGRAMPLVSLDEPKTDEN